MQLCHISIIGWQFCCYSLYLFKSFLEFYSCVHAVTFIHSTVIALSIKNSERYIKRSPYPLRPACFNAAANLVASAACITWLPSKDPLRFHLCFAAAVKASCQVLAFISRVVPRLPRSDTLILIILSFFWLIVPIVPNRAVMLRQN